MRLLPVLLIASLLFAPAALAEDPAGGDPDWSKVVPTETAPATEAAAPAEVGVPAETRAPAEDVAPAEAPAEALTDEPGVVEPKPFVMPTTSQVLDVLKHHNQDWRGNWKALDLELALAIVGQKGKRIGASIVFHEVANGNPLLATMHPYIDGDGHVSVYSQAVLIPVDSGVYTSRLRIPYRAFPWPTKGPAYAVEARIRLLRLEDNGTVTQLATGSTQFTIQFEAGCGVAKECPCPFGRTSGDLRDMRYDWHKLWGDCLGRKPSESGLPPPKGAGSDRPWFEAKWRTRGGCVDADGKPK